MLKLISTLLTILICLLSVPIAAQEADTSLPVDSSVLDSAAGAALTDTVSSSMLLTPDQQNQLLTYTQFKNIWRFFDIIITLAILYLILRTGLSAKLRDLALRIPNSFFSLWIYFALFMLIYSLMEFPFMLYRSFLVEGEYGFVNQTFGQWFSEYLLSLGVFILVGIIPVWLGYYIIRKTKRWWFYFSLALLPVLVVSVVLAPLLISPLFNKFTPLKDQSLKQEIVRLTEQAGLNDPDIFEVDASRQSSKINAYVTGLFGSKRIVLYDTMLEKFTTDEIIYVTAHELGHYVKQHVWIGVLIAILFIMLGFFLVDRFFHLLINKFNRYLHVTSITDIAGMPLLLLLMFLFNLLFQPITNGISRYQEQQADVYALEMSHVSEQAAVKTYEKLSAYNLSDPDPHPFIEFWFYTHPSLSKRISFTHDYYQNPKADLP